MIFMPKRALYSIERAPLSADEKFTELWGGLYTASKYLKENSLLGVNVGVPDQQYAERNDLGAPYGHPNYAALLYPGRMVVVDHPEDLQTLKPEFLILDKNWPEFTFPGDPRPADRRFVESPELVRVVHG